MTKSQNSCFSELSFINIDIEFTLWLCKQSIIKFHHLIWNTEQLEPAYENTDDDGYLEMRKNVAWTFSSTRNPKWAKLQSPTGMGSMGGKPVGIEPMEKEDYCKYSAISNSYCISIQGQYRNYFTGAIISLLSE